MRTRSLLCAGLLAATFSLQALAAPLNLPAPSVWTLNATKSDFGTMPAPASETITVSTFSQAMFSWAQDVVMPDGSKRQQKWSGPMDGSMQPVTGPQNSKASFKEDKGHFEYPTGMTADVTFSLSSDGKTLTESVIYNTQGNHLHQTHVYERAQ